jgi:glycosyltransferase involved in cell wall biosynthesis
MRNTREGNVSMCKISIIMANYNNEKYIKDSIDSIINQSFCDWELIVVDDSSTDNSVNIIKEYNDDRIILVENKHNLGPAKSRNLALTIAKGEYIAILDSDDISYKDRLKKQYEYIIEKGVHVLGCSVQYFGKVNKKFIPKSSNRDIRTTMLTESPYVHSSVMINGNILKTFDIKYDEEFRQAQDYKLWNDLSRYKLVRFGAVNETLVKYRVHSNQITSKSLDKQKNNATKVLKMQLMNIGMEVNDTDFDLYQKFIFDNKFLKNSDFSKVLDICFNIYKSIEVNKEIFNCSIFIERVKKQSIKYIRNNARTGRIYLASKIHNVGRKNKVDILAKFISFVRY